MNNRDIIIVRFVGTGHHGSTAFNVERSMDNRSVSAFRLTLFFDTFTLSYRVVSKSELLTRSKG